jgi:phosphonate transport system substrate-binding protein
MSAPHPDPLGFLKDERKVPTMTISLCARAHGRRRALAALLAIAVCLLPLSCNRESAAGERALRFTAIPERDTTELAKKYAPLADYLSRAVGVQFRYVPSADYSASVDMFTNGDVHLAWFGGLTGVQARRRVNGARAIAQGRVDPEYKTYFISHRDSGIERSDEFPHAIATRSFTFGSDASTSGRLMPTWFIRQATGKTPEEFFGTPALNFSGAHDKTIELVRARTFDVGAVDYKTYEKLVREGKIDPDEVRVIWVTPPYVDYNWTVHPDVDRVFGAGTIDKIQRALVELSSPELLSAMNRPEGLIPASNDDFASLAALAGELGLAR